MKKHFGVIFCCTLVLLITALTFSVFVKNPKETAAADLLEYEPTATMTQIYTEYKNFGYWDGAQPPIGCYPISSTQDLIYLSEMVNNSVEIKNCVFFLNKDLDFTDIEINPICNDENAFSGIFDGCNYTIFNLTMENQTPLQNVGLFGAIAETGNVKRLNINNANIKANFDDPNFESSKAGVISGTNLGEINLCSVTNSTVINYGKWGTSGAIVGYNLGNIKNSYASEIIIDGNNACGLTCNQNNGKVTNCFLYQVADAGNIEGSFYPFVLDPTGDNVINSYYCASEEDASYVHFISGKITLLLNNPTSDGSCSNVFGQLIGADIHPFFLTTTNYDSKLVNTVKFEYENEVFDLIGVNTGYTVETLPIPSNIFGTCTYLLNEAPFTTETEIETPVTVKVSGGTIINTDYLFVSATGKGTENEPFLISTASDLFLLSNACLGSYTIASTEGYVKVAREACYSLINDITFNTFGDLEALGKVICVTYNENVYYFVPSTKLWYLSTDLETPLSNQPMISALNKLIINWQPIDRFRGTFNGNDYTVFGLYYDNVNDYNGGFFDICEGNIKNFSVTGYIHTAQSAGGIAGVISNGSISNCINYADIKTDYDRCGGLAGANQSSTIKNCLNFGNISGNTNVSGIAGSVYFYTSDHNNISNCVNYGNIHANDGVAGGIVGYYQSYTSACTIFNCINYGDIESEKINAWKTSISGGIIGTTDSRYENAYNCANWGMVNSTQYGGGIIGYGRNNATISNCYWLEGCCGNENGYGSFINLSQWVNNCSFTYDTLIYTLGCNIDANDDGLSTNSLLDAMNEMASALPGCNIWEQSESYFVFSDDFYTLTYVPNFESEYLPTFVFTTGETIIFDSSYQRDGYEFLGWSENMQATEPDALINIGDPYTVSKDTSLFAIWAKCYKVEYIYNLLGIKDSYSEYYSKTESTFTTALFDTTQFYESPSLYVFLGWDSDQYAIMPTYLEDELTEINSDLKLYGIWEVAGYSEGYILEGSGTIADPFLVSSVEDLETIRYWMTLEEGTLYNIYFQQTKDIIINNLEKQDGYILVEIEQITYYYELNSDCFFLSEDLTVPLDEEEIPEEVFGYLDDIAYWAPLGAENENAFSGHYNGAGHSLSGLVITPDSSNPTGLFYVLEGASLSNLVLRNGILINGYISGAFAGVADSYSSLTNCGVENFDFYLDLYEGESQVGGLVGLLLNNSSIQNCYIIANLHISDENNQHSFGGLANFISENSSVTNCYVCITIFKTEEIYLEACNLNLLFNTVEFSETYPSIINCYCYINPYSEDFIYPFGNINDYSSDNIKYIYDFVLHTEEIASQFSLTEPPESGYWVVIFDEQSATLDFVDLCTMLNSNGSYVPRSYSWYPNLGPNGLPVLAPFYEVTFLNNSGNSVNGMLDSPTETITLSKRNAAGDIYYTLDGTDPRTLGILYIEPINVSHGTTLKAVEFFNGIYGAIKTVTFKQYISILYDTTLALSGKTPIDSNRYKEGKFVTLEDGSLLEGPINTPIFAGWALTPDATIGTITIVATYPASGLTITLYPVFISEEQRPDLWDGISVDTDWYYNNVASLTYNIYTAAEFAGISQIMNTDKKNNFSGKTIILNSDIDLCGHEWAPIGSSSDDSFSGLFNGNFHVIHNISIIQESTSTDYNSVGLFRSISNGGTVKNVGMQGGYIWSDSAAGGICAYLGEGSIKNCWTEGLTIEMGENPETGILAGGIVAETGEYAIITNCWSSAKITLNGYGIVGGIVGCSYLYETYVSNCYFAGSFNAGSSSNVGAICGYCYGYNLELGKIEWCYYEDQENLNAIGSFEGNKNCFFPIIPFKFSSENFILPYLADPLLDSNYSDSLEVTLNKVATISSKPWDNAMWVYDEFGVLRFDPENVMGSAPNFWTDQGRYDTTWYYNNVSASEFYINTPEALAGISYLVNKEITDFSGQSIYLVNDLYMEEYIWTPIGLCEAYSYFCGTFDGMGHVIYNLQIPKFCDFEYAGLFGQTDHAFIRNLGVADCLFFAEYEVGGIAGDIYNTNIENCFTTGELYAQYNCGGIVGYFSESVVANCWSSCEVSADEESDLGLIAGYQSSESEIMFCYWVAESEIPALGNGGVKNGSSFYMEDGEYLLTSPTDINDDGFQPNSLVEALNEAVIFFGPKKYARFKAGLEGYPIFEGYFTTFDVYTSFHGANTIQGNTGISAAIAGFNYILVIEASTGYTLNGSIISVKVGNLTLTSSVYSWTGDFNLPAEYVTGNISIELVAQKAYLAITKGTESNGTFDIPSNALYRSKVEISVYPDTGYEISSVTYRDSIFLVDNPAILNELTGKYEFLMTGNPALVKVEFAAISYDISYYDQDGEGVNGDYSVISDTGLYNQLITVSTNPTAGYEVDTVTYSVGAVNYTVDYDNGYKFNMPSNDTIVRVTFKATVFSITVSGTITGGQITVSTNLATVGTVIDIFIAIDMGFDIVNGGLTQLRGIYNGSSIAWSTMITYYNRQITMPAANMVIHATFIEEDYTLTAAATVNGSFVLKNDLEETITEAKYGETIHIVPTANTGYSVDNVQYWYGTYYTISFDDGYSFAMLANPTSVRVTFKKDLYSLTSNSSSNGSYTLSKNIANYGDTITISPTPISGYEILSVKYNDGSDHTVTADEDIYSFSMPASAVSVSVTFTEKSYTISKGAGINCTFKTLDLDDEEIEEIEFGEVVYVNITEDAGYYISRVFYTTINNQHILLTYDATDGYTLVMPASNITVYAEVIIETVNIIVDPTIEHAIITLYTDEDGEVPLVSPVASDAVVYFKYILNTGFSLKSVDAFIFTYGTYSEGTYTYVGDEEITWAFGLEDIHSLTMPGLGAGYVVFMTAQFDAENYSISYFNTDGETLSGNYETVASTASFEDNVTVSTSPETGYEVDKVTYTVGETEYTVPYYNSKYSFSMPASDITIKVTFKKCVYSINKTEQLYGYFTLSGNGTANLNDKIVITYIHPDSGYELASLKYNNGSEDTTILIADGDSSYSFKMPASNVCVTVSFSKIDYTVSKAIDISNGTIDTVISTVTITTAHYEDKVEIIPTPATGYIVDNIRYTYGTTTININFSTGYFFYMPTSDVTVSATFKKQTFFITKTASSNGVYSVTPFSLNAKIGDTVTLSVTPDTGYSVSLVKYNDGSDYEIIAVEGVYSFSMPAKSISLSVSFIATEYSITTTLPENGSYLIKDNEEDPIETAIFNKKIFVDVTPNVGFKLKTILVQRDSDSSQIPVNTSDNSFYMPSEGVTINVSFVLQNYSVSLTDSSTGLVMIKHTDGDPTRYISDANYNQSIIIIISPDPGYEVDTVAYSEDGTEHIINIDKGVYSLSMPAISVMVAVTFKEISYTISTNAENGTVLANDESSLSGVIKDRVVITLIPDNHCEISSLVYFDGENVITITKTNGRYSFIMPPKNVVVTATFSKIHYTLSFVSTGGSNLASITQAFGTEVSAPTPTKTGYTFANWYTDILLENLYIITTMPTENLELYAAWTINKYTLSFEVNNGASVSAITEDFETELSSPITTKTGYTLRNWYTDAELTTPYTFSTMPAEDITLYAGWTINKYTLSFEVNNGASVSAITEDFETELSSPITTKTGYTLRNWYTDAELTTPYAFSTMPAEDLTLYAGWTINKYTISANANGGSAVNPITLDYGSQITEPTSPAKVGYTFDGWYSDEALQVTFTSKPMPAENITLYAGWIINKYTLSFEVNNGASVSAITEDFETELSSPITTKTGYTFGSWYSDAELTTPYTFSTMPAEDLTLYAGWTINKYTLSFEVNNGASVSAITEDFETELSSPITTKTGYTFRNWYTDAELTALYTFGTMPAENITLYAGWTINKYTLSFEANDGSAVNAITEDFETALPTPTTTKTGYTFNNWYTDAELTALYTFGTMPAEDITLYAGWTINKYTITINANGGSTVSAIALDYDSQISEPERPVKLGYTFNGWYRDEALQVAFANERMPAESITLYASWKKIIITLPEDISANDITFNPNGTINIINPEKTGYSFEGWYLDPECTQFFNPETDTVTANMLLYPKWSILAVNEEQTLSGGAIAGIIIGSLAFTTLVSFLLYFFILKKKGFSLKTIFGKKPQKLDNLTAEKPSTENLVEEPTMETEKNPPIEK